MSPPRHPSRSAHPWRALTLGLGLCLALPGAWAEKQGFFHFPAFPPGEWELHWLEPDFTPRLDLRTQVSRFCYRQADQDADHDPVLPPAQQAACKGDFRDTPGGDITYTSRCGERYIQTRLSPDGEGGFRGRSSLSTGRQGSLDSLVILKRLGDC